jgi:inner membrane protein
VASLGHIAVGLAAARAQRGGEARWPALVGWSALSMLPDADVIAFAFGISYEAPWGHRGATHSFVFAAAVGLVVAALARAARSPSIRPGVIAALVVGSHPLLDTLTDGGLGCALLWPFDLTRYFAPWRPIPVSPIGLSFLSPTGLFVAVAELILFAPLFLYRWRPIPRPAIVVPIWCAAVWMIGSADPVRERLVGIILDEDTEYAKDYSERAFRQIAPGDPQNLVAERLGAPLGEWWDFDVRNLDVNPGDVCPFVYLEGGHVSATELRDACVKRGITAGMPAAAVRQRLGAPFGQCWTYTRSPSRRAYRGRTVCFVNGAVEEVIRRWGR